MIQATALNVNFRGRPLDPAGRPCKFFMCAGCAAFREESGSNMDVVREFGKGVADGLIQV